MVDWIQKLENIYTFSWADIVEMFLTATGETSSPDPSGNASGTGDSLTFLVGQTLNHWDVLPYTS